MVTKPSEFERRIMKAADKKSPSAPDAPGSNGVNGSNGLISLAEGNLTYSKRVQKHFGKYVGVTNLNLGCGFNSEPGFVNLDLKPGPGVDIVADLESPDRFATLTGSYDFVLASHVLEHIRDLIGLMRDIHRILRPGGHLGIACPYASSDDAVEDPTHVRFFTENSFRYFDKRLYERPGHAGHYDSGIDFIFEYAHVGFLPFPDVQEAILKAAAAGHLGMLDVMRRHQRNVVREMVVVLKKVEG